MTMLRGGGAALVATLPRMHCHLPVIRLRAEYRILNAPALGGRPCGGRANAFPPLLVDCAVLPRGLRGFSGCRGCPETLPRPTQPVCLGASAGVACLVPPTASLVLHVLQHAAAAAGLHVQCRVSCQLAAGLVPCVVWLN